MLDIGPALIPASEAVATSIGAGTAVNDATRPEGGCAALRVKSDQRF